MSKTSRFNRLSTEESAALSSIGQILEGLSESSQFRLLGELAKVYDREIVRPGAVRSAAATAAAIARVQVPAASVKQLKKSKTSRSSKSDPMFASWKVKEGKALIDAHDALVARLNADGHVLSTEERAMIAASSRDYRVAYDIFRAQS